MRNVVPEPVLDTPLAEQAASRAVAGRLEAYADEIRRLVDATYAVMRRTGSLDPRVGDIVQTAGLSNQAFYRHFRGKDELLLAVLDDGRRRLVGYLERAHGARSSPARHGCARGSKACSSRPVTPKPPRTPVRSR